MLPGKAKANRLGDSDWGGVLRHWGSTLSPQSHFAPETYSPWMKSSGEGL